MRGSLLGCCRRLTYTKRDQSQPTPRLHEHTASSCVSLGRGKFCLGVLRAFLGAKAERRSLAQNAEITKGAKASKKCKPQPDQYSSLD